MTNKLPTCSALGRLKWHVRLPSANDEVIADFVGGDHYTVLRYSKTLHPH